MYTVFVYSICIQYTLSTLSINSESMPPSALKPIQTPKTPKFREAAYQAIKDAILSGRLEPYRPLVEEQLAGMLNISRTPVREALALLEHEGLIGPQHGRGLYIRAISRKEFIDIFSSNEMVEPVLTRRAAENANPEMIGLLQETVRQGKQYAAQKDFACFLQVGREFHRIIGVASENHRLSEFVLRNEEYVDLYLMSTGKTRDLVNMLSSMDEHEAILDAIIGHNPDEAARLITVHAQSVRERYAELFNEQSDEAESAPLSPIRDVQ